MSSRHLRHALSELRCGACCQLGEATLSVEAIDLLTSPSTTSSSRSPPSSRARGREETPTATSHHPSILLPCSGLPLLLPCLRLCWALPVTHNVGVLQARLLIGRWQRADAYCDVSDQVHRPPQRWHQSPWHQQPPSLAVHVHRKAAGGQVEKETHAVCRSRPVSASDTLALAQPLAERTVVP
jgi:hypothetical protein